MPSCYTCGEDITFDKNILSKTGKQIPLTSDKKYTHGHDEQGNPTKKPLPNQGLDQQQTQQFNQYNRQPFDDVSTGQLGGTTTPPQFKQKPSSGFTATGQSQGGSYMDTKRLRVMVEELQKLLNFLDEKIESCYQLAKSNNTMLGELIQYFKINDPKSAKELYEAMENTKQEALKTQPLGTPPEVQGWNSTPNDNDDDNANKNKEEP